MGDGLLGAAVGPAKGTVEELGAPVTGDRLLGPGVGDSVTGIAEKLGAPVAGDRLLGPGVGDSATGIAEKLGAPVAGDRLLGTGVMTVDGLKLTLGLLVVLPAVGTVVAGFEGLKLELGLLVLSLTGDTEMLGSVVLGAVVMSPGVDTKDGTKLCDGGFVATSEGDMEKLGADVGVTANGTVLWEGEWVAEGCMLALGALVGIGTGVGVTIKEGSWL